MAAQPLVSVIVAARDAEATLAAALQSALVQTHRNLEIIVVDDGSIDRTAAIAREFARRDKRVRLLEGRGAGVSVARNLALAVASGRYVAPLDADDLWHEAKLERQVAAAESGAEPPGFVYCWLRHIDGEGRVVASGPATAFEDCVVHRHLYKYPGGAGGAALLLREAVMAAGGYEERLDRCEDLFLQLRIASHYRVAVVPEYLFGYRWLPNSLSRDCDAVLRNWTLMRALLREACPEVACRYDRWMYARQFYRAAEARLRPLRFFQALALTAGAVLRDPLWTFGTIWQRATLMIRPPPPAEPEPFFAEADPAIEIAASPGETTLAAAWLRRLDARRLAKLVRRDAAYAANSFPRRRSG